MGLRRRMEQEGVACTGETGYKFGYSGMIGWYVICVSYSLLNALLLKQDSDNLFHPINANHLAVVSRIWYGTASEGY